MLVNGWQLARAELVWHRFGISVMVVTQAVMLSGGQGGRGGEVREGCGTSDATLHF